jgi:hypothetical protein
MKYWHRFHISLNQIGSLMAQHKASLLFERFISCTVSREFQCSIIISFGTLWLFNPCTIRAILPQVNSAVSSFPAPLSPTASHSAHSYYPSKQLDDRSTSNSHAPRSSAYTTHQGAHTRCIQNNCSDPSSSYCWRVSTSDPKFILKLSGAAFLAPINIEITEWLESARGRLTALCGLPYPGDQHRTFHTAAGLLRRTLFGKCSLRWVLVQSLRSPSWRSS